MTVHQRQVPLLVFVILGIGHQTIPDVLVPVHFHVPDHHGGKESLVVPEDHVGAGGLIPVGNVVFRQQGVHLFKHGLGLFAVHGKIGLAVVVKAGDGFAAAPPVVGDGSQPRMAVGVDAVHVVHGHFAVAVAVVGHILDHVVVVVDGPLVFRHQIIGRFRNPHIGHHLLVEDQTPCHLKGVQAVVGGGDIHDVVYRQFFHGGGPPGLFKVQVGNIVPVQGHAPGRQRCGEDHMLEGDIEVSVPGCDAVGEAVVQIAFLDRHQTHRNIKPFADFLCPVVDGVVDDFPGQLFRRNFPQVFVLVPVQHVICPSAEGHVPDLIGGFPPAVVCFGFRFHRFRRCFRGFFHCLSAACQTAGKHCGQQQPDDILFHWFRPSFSVFMYNSGGIIAYSFLFRQHGLNIF